MCLEGMEGEDRKTHGGHEDSIMTSHNDDVDEDVPDSRSASEKNECNVPLQIRHMDSIKGAPLKDV